MSFAAIIDHSHYDDLYLLAHSIINIMPFNQLNKKLNKNYRYRQPLVNYF